jgi:hypothetical protein
MARPGITEQQVIHAAEALLREGLEPTVTNVRERLGSGSYSTINPHLGKWRQANEQRQPAQLPELPPSVMTAFRQIWALAWENTQAVVATEREALEMMRKQLLQERKEMEGEIQRLETEHERLDSESTARQQALEDERSTRQKVEQQVVELRIEKATLTERVTAADERGQELKQEIERLHARLQEAVAPKKAASGKKEEPHDAEKRQE